MRTARFTPGDIVTSVRLELFSRRESDSRIEELFAPLTTESIIALARRSRRGVDTLSCAADCRIRRDLQRDPPFGGGDDAGWRDLHRRGATCSRGASGLDRAASGSAGRILRRPPGSAIVMHEYEERCEIRSLLRPQTMASTLTENGASAARRAPPHLRGRSAGQKQLGSEKDTVELQTRAAIRLRLRIAVDNSLRPPWDPT